MTRSLMRVFEVAQEFNIEPEVLLQLLHAMGVRAKSQASAVPAATIAKLRARFERERRAGHEVQETIETVMEDTLSTAPKRRRRRKADIEPEPTGDERVDAWLERATDAWSEYLPPFRSTRKPGLMAGEGVGACVEWLGPDSAADSSAADDRSTSDRSSPALAGDRAQPTR